MTAFLSGEPKMYEAYTTGKDLYAIIAQSAFHNEYWENLEHYPEGYELDLDGQKIICGKKTHINKAGKERRSTGKVLNLASTYGMSGRTAGIRLGYTGDEAITKGTELLDNFFNGFPNVKEAIEASKKNLKETGYVEDFVGRKRHLPDINLPAYEICLEHESPVFNPFLICKNQQNPQDAKKLEFWQQRLNELVKRSNEHQTKKALENGRKWVPNDEISNTWYKMIAQEALTGNIRKQDKITHKYLDEYEPARYSDGTLVGGGVIIKANTGRRAQAERQCFNARIQGSAASLTKMAMVDIFKDERLKAMDANLIITVHDEVLVECPAIYADEVEKILPEIMVNAAAKAGDDVPQACDPYNVTRWYCDEYGVLIQDEFKKFEKSGLSREEALEKVYKNHTEVPQEAILKTIETGCDLDF